MVAARKGKEVRSRIDKSFLLKALRPFAHWPRACAEVFNNGNDAGSPDLILEAFDDPIHGESVRFIDHGHGLSEAGLEAYVCYNLSAWANNPKAKGHIGSGRLGALLHCKFFRCETKRANTPLLSLELDYTTLLKGLTTQSNFTWDACELPPDHQIKTTGTVVTWFGIGKGKLPNKQHIRTLERLVRELSNHLAPYVTRKVKIMTRDGEIHDLRTRKMRGDPVRGEALGQPVIGDIRWEIDIPEDHKHLADSLTVGGMGPLCTWAEFIRPIIRDPRYKTLVKPVHLTLSSSFLAGYIECDRINDWRLSDSGSVSADLYDDVEFVETLLVFLQTEVCPQIQDRVDKGSVASSDDTLLVSEVVKGIHEATGEVPTRKTKVTVDGTKFRIRVEIEPGRSHVIQISKPTPGVRYTWDADDCGGTLNTTSGTRVQYNAGKKLGKFIIRIYDEQRRSEAVHEVLIHIIEELPFRFTRAVARLDVKSRTKLRLDPRAIHHTSGEIVWSLDNDDGGTLKVGEGGLDAVFTSFDNPGTYFVRAQDKSDPDRYNTRCTIVVERGYSRKSGGDEVTEDTEFIYQGRRFMVDTIALPSASHASMLMIGETMSTINLNLDHSLFADQKDDVRRSQILYQLCLRIADAMLVDEVNVTPETFLQQANTIQAEFSTSI